MLYNSSPGKSFESHYTFESRHDKTNKMSVHLAKTRISLGIRPVWSESLLSAWRNLGSLATHWVHSEDSGWSESSLGAHSFSWFCHVVAHLELQEKRIKPLLSEQWSDSGNSHILHIFSYEKVGTHIFLGPLFIHFCIIIIALLIWAMTWQNQQSEYAPSEDSDQPGHLPSLIRVFAVRMKKAWVLSYTLSRQRRLWSDWVDAQADLSLCWAHSHFVGFVMLRFISLLQENTDCWWHSTVNRRGGLNKPRCTCHTGLFWTCQSWPYHQVNDMLFFLLVINTYLFELVI